MKIGDFIEIQGEDIVFILRVIKDKIWQRFYVPRNKKNKLGIVIAITTENLDERLRVEKDLVNEIKKYINIPELSHIYNIVTFSNLHSSKIENPNIAKKYLDKSGSHLIIYGTLMKRKDRKDNKYIFNLNGVVKHRFIPIEISNRLSKEFAKVLPNQLSFYESDEILGFPIAGKWIGIAYKYILGIAGYINGQFFIAYDIMHQLRKEILFLKKTNKSKALDDMLGLIPERLKEILIFIINLYGDYYRTSRNKKYVFEGYKYGEELIQIDPNYEDASILKATCLYFQGEIDNAISLLEKCSLGNPKITISLGFLYAFKGNEIQYLNYYGKLLNKKIDVETPADVEMFLNETIEDFPDKIQLLYLRGFINHKIKGDYRLAKEDFEMFKKKNGNEIFPRTGRLVEKYLFEVNRELSKTKKAS